MTDTPDKPKHQASPEPQPDEGEIRLREVSEDQLKRILEAHEAWVRSEGKEGERADLHETNLEKADLHGANLNSANLQVADLSGANLREADLADANLQDAFLNGANLRGAFLHRANLEGAILHRANLQGADLSSANLQVTVLTGANLEGARLSGVNLKEASLFTTKGLTQEQLNEACGDAETTLPDYLSGYKMKRCPESGK